MSRRDVTRLTSLRPPVLGKHSMNAEFTISMSRARIERQSRFSSAFI